MLVRVVKMKVKEFLVILFLIFQLHGSVDSNQRIYGGYQIDVTEAPYMVAILIQVEQYSNGLSKIHECGGTILRRNLILTAAHCTVNTKNNRMPFTRENFIVVSETNQIDPNAGTTHSVKTVFAHPKYRNASGENRFHDVGLLELDDEITLSAKAQLVTLAYPNDKPAIGADCIITGYGTNPDHARNKDLYQVHLNVITSEQCVKELAEHELVESAEEYVEKHNICVKAPNKNQCRGDSGGPLIDVSTYRQVGIVSFGDRDCTTDTPSVDARVTDNLDFIEDVICQTTPQTDANPQTKPKPYKPSGSTIMKPTWYRH